MTLTSRFNLAAAFDMSTALDLGTDSFAGRFTSDITLVDGAGASAANLVFAAEARTIAASATDSLDLAGGGLLDPQRNTLVFARIKALYVRASAANNAANNVVVTRPAANGVPLFTAAGDSLALRAGEVFTWISPTASGVAVTAGTGDLLDFVNSAGTNSVVYDVVILGAAT
ncbi:MAG TPA: hypothetical protein VK878_23165 [Candidatus Deferrimicrobiaceae bacterium]|nr:hypothetical protein [Candidatus Deferrimicrobiaceae bacterium]